MLQPVSFCSTSASAAHTTVTTSFKLQLHVHNEGTKISLTYSEPSQFIFVAWRTSDKRLVKIHQCIPQTPRKHGRTQAWTDGRTHTPTNYIKTIPAALHNGGQSINTDIWIVVHKLKCCCFALEKHADSEFQALTLLLLLLLLLLRSLLLMMITKNKSKFIHGA